METHPRGKGKGKSQRWIGVIFGSISFMDRIMGLGVHDVYVDSFIGKVNARAELVSIFLGGCYSCLCDEDII